MIVHRARKRCQEPFSRRMLLARLPHRRKRFLTPFPRFKHSDTGKPLAKVYVKVYAQMQDGAVKFYKDGYTDLRGRFDYTSLSTNELDFVKKFSLLVLSEEHGACLLYTSPSPRD